MKKTEAAGGNRERAPDCQDSQDRLLTSRVRNASKGRFVFLFLDVPNEKESRVVRSIKFVIKSCLLVIGAFSNSPLLFFSPPALSPPSLSLFSRS